MQKDAFIAGVTEKYPERLLENRLSIECNVIGTIWNDILVLEEVTLTKDDFITSDGRFYFQVAKQLKKNNHLNQIDEIAVLNNLSPDVMEKFEERGGYETIDHIASIVSLKNKDSYLDALRKSNIILSLYRNGFNLLSPIQLDNGKNIAPIDIFDRTEMDSNSVIEWYEAQMSKMGSGYDVKVLEDEDIEITDSFLERLSVGDEQGTSYEEAGTDVNGEKMSVFPYLSKQTLGFTKGASHYIAGFSSSGKTAMWCSMVMALVYQGEKVLIICNEQSSKVWKINMLTFILYKHFRCYNVTKTHLMSGKFSDEYREIVDKAKDYFNENYKGKIHFIQLAENNMGVIKSKIRYYALQYGYTAVVYDTFKIEDIRSRSGKEAQAWEHLVQYSRDLDIMAKKYDLIMLCSIQLAQSYKGYLWLDSNMLSGAKGIVEQLDTLLCLRDVYKEELDPNSKIYCKPYQLKRNEDGTWREEPYECDPKDSWKFLFLSKSRNSQNSNDSGSCLMFRFQGQFAIFQERCWARPKHGQIQ